jgi:serine phosphatase RsbU (regulator of sigma subunit)
VGGFEATPAAQWQPVDPRLEDVVLLIVEDDTGDALYLSACLEELGPAQRQVEWASSLAEALAATDKRPPDCILVDLGLPDAVGMEAVDAVLGAAPDAAVIVLTGLDDPRVERALLSGAQDYLIKSGLTADTLSRSVRYAVERKRAVATSRQLQRAELQSAENTRLERGLLPTPFVSDPDIRWATSYQPAHGHTLLGGDFYDVAERSDGSLRLIVGDVMGHGPDQAALGVHLRAGWRSLVLAGLDQRSSLVTVHQMLVTEAPTGCLVTACDLLLSPDRRRLTVCNFGHPPIVLGAGPTVEYLSVPPSPPLGFRPRLPPTVVPVEVPLPAQWRLLLYTDGLLDRFRSNGTDGIGLDGLLCAAGVGHHNSANVHDWLAAIVSASTEPVSDDVAIMAISYGSPSGADVASTSGRATP